MLYFNSITPTTTAGSSGAAFLEITNLRIKTTGSAAIDSEEVITDLLETVVTTSGGRISDVTGLIDENAAAGVDHDELIFEDALPGDALTQLAQYGDGSEPYRVGVDNEFRLFYKSRESGRVFYALADRPSIERSVAQMINSAYVVYKDERDITRRTAVLTSSDSEVQFGLTRRAAVKLDTISSTRAENERTVFLTEVDRPDLPGRLTITYLTQETQEQIPFWELQIGDIVVIQNLPQGLPDAVRAKLERVQVAEVSYSVSDGGERLQFVLRWWPVKFRTW